MKQKTLILLLLSMILTVMPIQAREKLVLTSHPDIMTDMIERILTKAYNKIGFDIIVERLPPERALKTSNSGQVDGELYRIAHINKKYTNLIMIPVPITHVEGVAFVKTVDFTVKGWESLKPYNLGITLGIKFLENNTKGMNRVMVNQLEQLFLMLNKGRIDIVLDTRLSGLSTLAKLNLSGIHILEPPLAKLQLYHYLHKKNASLVSKITVGLQLLEKEGRIEKIRNQFISALEVSIKDTLVQER